MARYVDGYLLPVPKKNLKAYMAMAKKGAKIWMDHGALQYCETAAEDLTCSFGLPFPKMMKTKPTDTVVFSFIVFKSRAHRDKVNAAVMKDPRIAKLCDPKKMPFDCKKMGYGGFSVLVEG